MLIICTQDTAVLDAYENTAGWGNVYALPIGTQAAATTQLKAHLNALGPAEPLCIVAHGNNTLMGDPNPEGWTWTTGQIAEYLWFANAMTWTGPVLFQVCCTDVANFSAGVAVQLGGFNDQGAPINSRAIWCYGYNT